MKSRFDASGNRLCRAVVGLVAGQFTAEGAEAAEFIVLKSIRLGVLGVLRGEKLRQEED